MQSVIPVLFSLLFLFPGHNILQILLPRKPPKRPQKQSGTKITDQPESDQETAKAYNRCSRLSILIKKPAPINSSITIV